MFLKKKRDGLVKACMCADGCKQKDGTWLKQETTSLMVAMESVVESVVSVIDCLLADVICQCAVC